MLRIGSSAVATNALRAIFTCRSFSATLITSQHHIRSLCSDAKKQNDLKLVKLLNYEIKSKHVVEKTMPEVPADFPFSIQNEPLKYIMILKREFNGENIEVEVFAAKEDQKILTLFIRISKQNGTIMDLWASLSADNITVKTVELMEPAASNSDHHHFGPHTLNEADSEWQVHLREFLGSRGIKNTCFGFLWEMIIENLKQCPSLELKMLKTFLKD